MTDQQMQLLHSTGLQYLLTKTIIINADPALHRWFFIRGIPTPGSSAGN